MKKMTNELKIYYTNNEFFCMGAEDTDVTDMAKTHHELPQVAIDGLPTEVISAYVNAGKVKECLEVIFRIMNNYTSNPLSHEHDNGMQAWVRSVRTHTSMSVGDVVQINGTHWFCDHVGWTQID